MSRLSPLIGSIAERILATVERLQTEATPLDQLLDDIAALPGVQVEIDPSLSSLYAYADGAARSAPAINVSGLGIEQLRVMVAAREALFWYEPKDRSSVLITASNITIHVHGLMIEATQPHAA